MDSLKKLSVSREHYQYLVIVCAQTITVNAFVRQKRAFKSHFHLHAWSVIYLARVAFQWTVGDIANMASVSRRTVERAINHIEDTREDGDIFDTLEGRALAYVRTRVPVCPPSPLFRLEAKHG